MRKLNLAILAMFISLNVNAAPTNLNNAINKSFDRQANSQNQHSTIVYGGKDISRSIVAAAHENTWTKQSVLIG